MAQEKSSFPASPKALLTIDDAALILGVSRPTVYELIYHAGLPTVKLGKSRRILPDSLQQWLKEREHGGRSA